MLDPASRVASGTFGISVSLPANDPLEHLLDPGWSRLHWFATAAERDSVMADMQRRHEYSRDSDKPALVFKAIDRDHQGQ